MSFDADVVESQEYRVVLVKLESRQLLAIPSNEGPCLPRVRVSNTDRPAEVLQASIREQWKLPVYMTGYLPTGSADAVSPCVLGEVFHSEAECQLISVNTEQLLSGELTDEELHEVQLRLDGRSHSVEAVGRFGWLDEAYRWAGNAIGTELAGKDTVRQQNIGGGFVLLRLQTLDGRFYWLKATAHPNKHELKVTRLIAGFANDALPTLVASHEGWNAWLTADASADQTLGEFSTRTSSASGMAPRVLAKLQAISQYHLLDLLRAGAFDQRPETSEEVSRELFEYLHECMGLQRSRKTAPLDRSSLDRTREIYLRGCAELERKRVPFTVVHGDLTGGNVACTGNQCRFLDWCETYIGFPIASLHHLRMFFERNGVDATRLDEMMPHYQDEWGRWSEANLHEDSFQWAPLMAAASALYGRGEWLHRQEERERPERRSYSRTLARHMARAAQEFSNGAIVCA